MSKTKRARPLRPFAPAHLVPAPLGASIRTRLPVSERDVVVLETLGRHLGHLANLDLVSVQSGVSRKERKQTLTAASSARYAGAITAETNRRVRSEKANRRRYKLNLVQAIDAISERLDLAPDKGGYPTGAVRYKKQVRLRGRQSQFATLAAQPHVPVVRGGHRLWAHRAVIENDLAARLAKTSDPGERQFLREQATRERVTWREHWDAARLFLRALGSRDELDGNLTIRVEPGTGRCSLLLPEALRHLANDRTGRHYILDAPVFFSYREPEWRERTGNAALTYTITHRLERKGRWYIDASWSYLSMEEREEARQRQDADVLAPVVRKACTPASTPPPPVLAHGRVLAVDFNADHLAAWVLDEHGNPVGQPYRIPLLVRGLPTATRDGHVRDAITVLFRLATLLHITTIVCEDLGWSDETGRDVAAGGKSFRHLISGFPTTIFRERLGAMAARAGFVVVAVDPAYTSMWGAAYWQKPTTTSHHITTGHEAAAIVIGRRGQGYRASRRAGVPSSVQSDLTSRATAQGATVLGREVARSRRRTPEPSGWPRLDHLSTRLATTVRAGPVVN